MCNILIVEDQEHKYLEILQIFDKNKVNITWSNELVEATYKIANESYDLIILDISLSWFEGICSEREIEGNNLIGSIDLFCKTPTIVITQFNDYRKGELFDSKKNGYLLNVHYNNLEYYENSCQYDFSKDIFVFQNLHENFCANYYFYIGAVCYRYDSWEWMDYAKELILKVEELRDGDIITR